MVKSDFKDSLKKQMLTMTLVPVVLLTVAIIVTSVSIVRASITNQIKDELIHDAQLIGFVFDEFYVGDYRIEETGEEGEIEIYKGEQKLNGEDTLIATMSDFLDIDVSIFIEDTRILTTLHDEDGNSAMGTKAAAVVKNEVLKTGESVFYDNVVVYDKKSFAYYTALKDDKDEIIGMIAVCRSAEDVQEEVFKYVLPIIGICIVVAVFFGFIMVHEGNKLAGRIFKMDI